MKKMLLVVGTLVLMGSMARGETRSGVGEVVRAAEAFLGTLDEKQKGRVSFAFDDEKQRARWSNFPTSFVRRAGLSMGELSEGQRGAAMTFLSAALSERGMEKVRQMMGADEALKNEEGNDIFGKDLYYISILGKPSETEGWMLQFGGHHLGLNLTMKGGAGVLTPSLTGAQPAMYEVGGKVVRPLGRESDKAFALMNSLDEGERKKAVLNYRVADLVLGPGQDGKVIEPEGLKGAAMTEGQRGMMLDLISEWAGIVNDGFAAGRIEEIKGGLDETWFAWSGPTTVEAGKNGTAYYRIQGPKVVIEYAPQRLGGDLSMHVHTIYRDPTNDYGRAAVGK